MSDNHPHNPNIVPPTKVVEPSGPSSTVKAEPSNPEKDRQLREKQAAEELAKSPHPIPPERVVDAALSSSRVEAPSKPEQDRQDRAWDAAHQPPSDVSPQLTPDQIKHKAEEDAKFRVANRPPSTPLLKCFHGNVGCGEVALNPDDATKKGWYADAGGVWYCKDHGVLRSAAEAQTRAVK